MRGIGTDLEIVAFHLTHSVKSNNFFIVSENRSIWVPVTPGFISLCVLFFENRAGKQIDSPMEFLCKLLTILPNTIGPARLVWVTVFA